MSPRILYVSGTYCPSTGGAEISAHNILKHLQQAHGFDVQVLTSMKYAQDPIYDSVSIHGTTHEQRVQSTLDEIDAFKPDVILTQLLWSDIAMRVGRQTEIPTMLRVCKIPFGLDISLDGPYAPNDVLAVSQHTAEYLRSTHKRESLITPPLVDPARVVDSNEKRNNPYVLMFNTLRRKGAHTFSRIAELMPDRRFAIVSGWNILKNRHGFDPTKLERMCESLGIEYSGSGPEIVDTFPGNVDILPPSTTVRDIYREARLLLVPSVWEETFGRVAIEGFYNRIPVIASAVGGLQEHAHQGGIVIEDFENAHAWKHEIERLDDEQCYLETADRGTRYLETSYRTQDSLEQLVTRIGDLVG